MPKNKNRKRSTSIVRQVEKINSAIMFLGPAVTRSIHAMKQGWGIEGAVDQWIQAYSGYSPMNRTFDIEQLKMGYGPYVVNQLVSKGIHKLVGIIRRL